MFENLRLTLAKKRCEWECKKTIISENFCVFPFVKISGYHLMVFIFKLNQIYIYQTTIFEKHLRRYYVRMNSTSKSKSWQIIVHFARGKKIIKKTSSNQSCGRDRECEMVHFKVPQYRIVIIYYKLMFDAMLKLFVLLLYVPVKNYSVTKDVFLFYWVDQSWSLNPMLA